MRVFRLPVAALEVVFVLQKAVGDDSLLGNADRLLGDERPAVRAAGVGEQALKGGFDGPLVCGGDARIGLERSVVLADRFVRGLNGGWHGENCSGAGHGSGGRDVCRAWLLFPAFRFDWLAFTTF